MAAKGGRIDFMFLAPPYPAAGSATGYASYWNAFLVNINLSLQPMDLYLWIFIRDKGYCIGNITSSSLKPNHGSFKLNLWQWRIQDFPLEAPLEFATDMGGEWRVSVASSNLFLPQQSSYRPVTCGPYLPLLVQAGSNVWFIPHHSWCKPIAMWFIPHCSWCKLAAMCDSYLTTLGVSWQQCVADTSPLLVQAGSNVWFIPHHSWCKLAAMCGSYLTTIGASLYRCVIHTPPCLVTMCGSYLTTLGASWWQCMVHTSPLLVQADSNVVHTSLLVVQAGSNVWFIPHHSWCKLVVMCDSYPTMFGDNVWFMPHHYWCKLVAMYGSYLTTLGASQ